jgi:hypothetical protein
MDSGEIELELRPSFPAIALDCHAQQALGNNPVLNMSVYATLTIMAAP